MTSRLVSMTVHVSTASLLTRCVARSNSRQTLDPSKGGNNRGLRGTQESVGCQQHTGVFDHFYCPLGVQHCSRSHHHHPVHVFLSFVRVFTLPGQCTISQRVYWAVRSCGAGAITDTVCVCWKLKKQVYTS